MNLDSFVYCRSDRETLWAAIFNPEAWKASIPDAHEYEEIAPNEYEMTVRADLGPIKGNQTVKLIFSDLNEPLSCNLKVEHKMLKSMQGSYNLELPTEVTSVSDKAAEDAEEAQAATKVMPVGTRTIFRYHLDVDMGNPMFNAIVESFKSKVESGFAEILGRLDNYASGEAAETTN